MRGRFRAPGAPHPRGAEHDDPVFGPVHVALQAERGARMDDDALHPEAVAEDQRFEPAPGAMLARKGFRLSRAPRLKRGDRRADPLRAGSVRHQHRVGHGHGDDVPEPDPHDLEALGLGPQQRVRAVDRGRVPRGDDARGVRPHLVPDRVPAAEVRPASGEGHDGEVRRALHHRVVEGDVAGVSPCLGVEPEEAEIGSGARQRLRLRGRQVGRVRGGRLQHGARGEEKYPGVPEAVPGGEHPRCVLRVGLLDEPGERLRLSIRAIVEFQPAEPRLGAGGRDADGHDPPRARGLHALRHGSAEGLRVGHCVIGGRGEDQRVGVRGREMSGRCEDGGSGIARLRLDHDGSGVDSGRRQLFGDDESEVRGRHHDGRCEAGPRQPPQTRTGVIFGLAWFLASFPGRYAIGPFWQRLRGCQRMETLEPRARR